jgi:hypothetical protein
MAAKAVIDPNFIALLQALREEAAQFAASARLGLPGSRFSPTLLASVDLSTADGPHEDLAKVFELPEVNRALIATYNQEDPGNLGDNLTLTTQLDYAAQLERAYRARHLQPFPRMIAHATARKDVQAAAGGVFTGQVQNYVTGLLRQGAGGVATDGNA